MSRSRVFADLRKHRGDARNIVGLIENFASSKEADVDWLLRPDQAPLSPPGQVIGYSEQFDLTWATQVRDRIAQLAQNESGGSFWVFSYDAAVRAETERLNKNGISVTSRSPAELIAQASMQRMARSISTITESPRIPRSEFGTLTFLEAAEVAKKALRRGGHISRETALSQPSLRPRMVDIDSRARKSHGNPASEALITTIVNVGKQEGWLERFRRVDGQIGTEAVYLIEPATVPPYVSLPETRRVENENRPDESPSNAREPIGPKKHPNRATTFEQELSKLRIGSMPETRLMVIDAVESTLSSCEKEKPTLATLFAKSALLAQDEAARQEFTTERNWPIAVKCIQRLMLGAGVILDEHGSPIRDTIGSASSRVCAIAPDSRRECEAHMAHAIIRRLDGISFDDDLYYLGLVLYRRGKVKAVSPEDLKSRADELLSFMQNSKRIEMGEDRIIRAR
jgi:hypothetical protein